MRVNYKINRNQINLLFYSSTSGQVSKTFTFSFQRVMPTYWYVLLRYFLRVDDVLVRSHETRMFHMLNSNYILREFTAKESTASDLNVRFIFTRNWRLKLN